MAECRVIRYSDEWYGKLKAYMHKTFPTYSKAYIEYCILHSKDRESSIIVVDGNGVVVGCHLYYCVNALMDGEVIETQWGHDTYLDDNYRKEIGVDFLLARKKIPAFGVGLTDTNAKMRKLMKSVFLKGVYNYYIITPLIVCSPFQKIFHSKKQVKDIDCLNMNGITFKRVHSPEEMTILNGGFWFKGYNELDFIRDAEFINYRFFNCKVHDYKVYASKDSYFVVRESTYRGMPAMMLSDFRYNPASPESATILLKAVRKLAVKSGYGLLYFVCGDKNVEEYFRRKIHFKTSLDFITSYKISPETTFTLCGGDSDAEFLKV